MLYNFFPVHTLPTVSVDFSPYQAVLLDLDGTIYREQNVLPGAVALVQRLRADGRKFACLSNSNASPLQIVIRLGEMGVELEPDQIYTAAAAAADYVVQQIKPQTGNRPRVFNLSSEGMHDMLEGLVDWVQTDGEPCDAVVIGSPACVYATEDRQRVALRLLRKGAAAIGICGDRVYPSPRGLEFGTGALTWMLCYAASVEPVFCGKPQEIFYQELCTRLHVSPDWCLLIGDNLESDIYGARALGMRTILTLTGVTRRRDLLSVPAEYQPDLVVEDLTELV